jgi:hypothetical protein
VFPAEMSFNNEQARFGTNTRRPVLKKFLIITICLTCFSGLFGQPAAAEQSNKQTKALAILNSSLQELQFTIDTNIGMQQTKWENSYSFSLADENLIVNYKEDLIFSPEADVSDRDIEEGTVIIPLAKLDPQNIKISKGDITLNCLVQANCVNSDFHGNLYTEINNKTTARHKNLKMNRQIFFLPDDPKLKKRVVKALRTLIKSAHKS